MKKLNYSWMVCFSGALVVVCTFGMQGNVFSVYLPHIEAMGFSGTQTSFLVTLRCVFTFASMLLVNCYYSLLSLRTGLCCAMLFSAAGSLFYSTAESMPMMCAAAAMCGISYGFGSMIPLSILMRRWFNEHQAFAISICSAGSGISTVCFPPLITWLINHGGMAFAFRVEAGFAVICAALAYLIIRDEPKMLKMEPYGSIKHEQRSAGGGNDYDMSGKVFCLLAAVMLLMGGVVTAAIAHLSILFTSDGYSVSVGAAAVSVFGLTLFIGKFLFGVVSDRYGGRASGELCFALGTAGCAICFLCPENSVAIVVTGSILMGLGFPVASIGSSIWAADFSTEANYAKNLKWFQILYQLGGILFSFIPGVMYDMSGSYKSSYALFAMLMLAMLLVLQMAYRQKKIV